jgi:hypothetical protein
VASIWALTGRPFNLEHDESAVDAVCARSDDAVKKSIIAVIQPSSITTSYGNRTVSLADLSRLLGEGPESAVTAVASAASYYIQYRSAHLWVASVHAQVGLAYLYSEFREIHLDNAATNEAKQFDAELLRAVPEMDYLLRLVAEYSIRDPRDYEFPRWYWRLSRRILGFHWVRPPQPAARRPEA